MQIIEMFNTLNANTKVEGVVIGLSSYNELNDEIIALMMTKYTNLYSIHIHDYNDSIDSKMHELMKQWVK